MSGMGGEKRLPGVPQLALAQQSFLQEPAGDFAVLLWIGFPGGQGWSCRAHGSEVWWVGSTPRRYGGLRPHPVQVVELLCSHSGSHLGRPDLLPRTLPVDEANSDSVATTLSTSSLGSGGLHSPANR